MGASNKGTENSLRIAKLIAQRGVCSRREAENRIREGRVLLNGELLRDPATNVNADRDEIQVDGVPLPSPQKEVYLALHKPTGYLSSFTRDREQGRTLEELLNFDQRLFPAGRLDRDSSGLLILTTDGDWANRVMHPRYEKEKEYLVRFKGVRPKPATKVLRQARFYDKGRAFGADRIEQEGPYVRVVLHEGRNRHVRRLARAANLEVSELVRVRVGPVELGELKPGKHRRLSDEEVRGLAQEG